MFSNMIKLNMHLSLVYEHGKAMLGVLPNHALG